ncbi:MAG: putative toxin-antitoxin system toxin component, PIN family [Muribaculaceae bacterium]|nr:putative toxin-antitoxin system toxin component, PIN family [Muribaculaceae bacterium]
MNDLNKVYAVIDTNVLVSALLTSTSSSNPFIILNAIYNKRIVPIFNDIILSEYREVLMRPKFHLSLKQVELVLNFLVSNGISIVPVKEETIYFPDPKDIVFYEVRMAVDDSYLVTGNQKHFPNKPFVVTPAQMVEILIEKGLI